MKDQNKLLKKCLAADIPAIVFQGTDKCAVEILQSAAEIYKKNGCSEEFLFDFEQLIKNFEGYQVENSHEVKVPALNDSEKEVVRMDMKATAFKKEMDNAKIENSKDITGSNKTLSQNEFRKWAKDNNIKIFNRLSEVTTEFDKDFVVGQKCTFTNEYGIKFENLTIMGFCEKQNNSFTGEDSGRYVYLDKDSYWLPVNPHSIRLEKTAENNLSPIVISNRELCSSGSRTLIGDFTAGKDSQMTNFHIQDRSTGETKPLNTSGVDLSKESPETLKKILLGAKTNTSSGLLQLSKTSLGWGLTVVKQAIATANASAGI